MPAHPTVAGAAPPIQAQGRSLEQMAAARQRKIERYRARKALEKKQQVIARGIVQWHAVAFHCH